MQQKTKGRMSPFFKFPSRVKKGHNFLDKLPEKKTIDLKKMLRLVKSHVSLYHCSWFLIVLLLQVFILLVFLTTRRGSIPPHQFSHIHPQEKHHHQQQEGQQQGVIHQVAPPHPSNEKQVQVVIQQQQQQQQRPEEVNQQPAPPPPDDDGGDNTNQSVHVEQVISRQAPSPPEDDRDNKDEICKFGKVYLYDIPPKFNKDLVKNCDDLDPWKSKCDAVCNDGLGPNATSLAGTVPQELTPSWWWTDMFASEIIYHIRMSNYKCRTMEPESATAFYVPFYAGLAISKYLFTNYTPEERDHRCKKFLGWMKEQPYWKRSNGSDHFLVLGRITWDFRRKTDDDWGSRFLFMPLMKNMLKLVVEQNIWDPLEISIPYPTGFHPRSASEIEQWQEFVRSRNRTNLFTFVGAKRLKVKDDFRALLFDHCYNESDSCKLVDCAKTPCSDGSSAIFETFLHSDFCLQPKGDSETRKSMFDCMLSGSIPVYFWEGSFRGQYKLFLPGEPESYSVFINHEKVRNGTSVRRVLEGYSKEDIKRMRDNIIDFIPRFLYGFPSEGLGNAKDAFDIAVEEVLQRMVKKPSVTGQ